MYNQADALLVLALLIGACPVAFKLLALAGIWSYPLTEAQQAQLHATLTARDQS